MFKTGESKCNKSYRWIEINPAHTRDSIVQCECSEISPSRGVWLRVGSRRLERVKNNILRRHCFGRSHRRPRRRWLDAEDAVRGGVLRIVSLSSAYKAVAAITINDKPFSYFIRIIFWSFACHLVRSTDPIFTTSPVFVVYGLSIIKIVENCSSPTEHL